MKPRYPFQKTFGTLAGITLLAIHTHAAPGYAAHEWGTFTSVSGGDGALLQWQPLENAELPKFVYDWNRAGLGRPNPLAFDKARLTLQRMETPVIYFYADEEQSVDVSVQFPKGLITEWYPQAGRIGPHNVETASPEDARHLAKDSRIQWPNVKILPVAQNAGVSPPVPSEKSGNHYFAARQTDSAFVRVNVAPADPPEHEKFLFYRGVGSFPTPLQVTMTAEGELKAANNGTEKLSHLFVLMLRDGKGTYFYLDQVPPGESRSVKLPAEAPLPAAEVSKLLRRAMAESLVSEGLFPREATAMVETWNESWFAEEGIRVLYVLPRTWTDATLPIEFAPAPRDLVRVMVGRAEVIEPAIQEGLRAALLSAAQGDRKAHAEASASLRKLGRFAQPALHLASQGLDKPAVDTGWNILQTLRPRLASQ